MTDVNPHPVESGPTVDLDTYGLLLLELLEGRDANEIMERSDGLIYVGDGSDYFHRPESWPDAERAAIQCARGRVLDIGCGAGRITLALQDRGLSVLAIDESATAIDVTKRRGAREAKAMRWQDITPDLGAFDTIVLARNNFGLLGDKSAIAPALRELTRLAAPGAVLISDSVAPSRGGDSLDVYRYRVRHLNLTTPWFRYLMFEPAELGELVADTGWGVYAVFDTGQPRWNFVLRRTDKN